METAELAELIKSRRSIRVWQDKPVPEELLLQAIELATWAPNGGNQQNWRFYVILNKDVLKALGDAEGAGFDYLASWPEMAQAGFAPKPGAPKPQTLSRAKAIIAVAVKKSRGPFDPVIEERAKADPKAAQMLQWSQTIASRIQSAASAIAYLLLVLHQMGLGGVWMTGPLPQSKGEIEKILNVPEEMDIIAVIPVGYPAESPTKNRKPVSEVCKVIK